MPDLAIDVRQSLDSGYRAVVPSLWRLEMANGFAVAERRGDLASSFADRCLDDLERLTASVVEESAEVISLRQAHSVARQYRLTAYDAAYLETARREGLPLATLDRALGEAAKKGGVRLFR